MKRKPYQQTNVNWATTQGQIQSMLEKFGIVGSRWTSLKNDDDSFIVRFEFVYIVSDNAGNRKVPCRIDVPVPSENDRNRLMRMLFWFLKSKLESIEAEFKEFEEEFFPYIVLPGDVTIYEAMLPKLRDGDLDGLRLFTLKALPEKAGGGKK